MELDEKMFFEPGWNCEEIQSLLQNDRKGLLEFVSDQLSREQFQDDYKEF